MWFSLVIASVLLALQACGGGGGGGGGGSQGPGLRGPTPDDISITVSPARTYLDAGHAGSVELTLTNFSVPTWIDLQTECPQDVLCGASDISIFLDHGETTTISKSIATALSTPVGEYRIEFVARTRGIVPDAVSADAMISVSADTSGLSFRAVSYSVPAHTNSGLAIGYLDSDPHLDVAYSEGNSIYSLLGSLDGRLTQHEMTSLPADLTNNSRAGVVKIADFNNDQASDVVVSDLASQIVVVPTVGGSFDEPLITPVNDLSQASNPLDAGDFNDDGSLDVVVGGRVGGGIVVLLGNGDGTFGQRASFDSGISVRSLQTGDLDADGVLDIVLSDQHQLRRLLGMGDGSFGSSLTFYTPDTLFAPLSGAITLVDLTNDGIRDVATGLDLFVGAGAADFFLPESLGTSGRYVTSGDFNGDGRIDLAYAEGETIAIVLNDLGGLAAPSRMVLECGGASQIEAGDLNGDGVSDLVIVGSGCLNTLLFGSD